MPGKIEKGKCGKGEWKSPPFHLVSHRHRPIPSPKKRTIAGRRQGEVQADVPRPGRALNGHLRKAKAAGTLKAYLWPGVRQETNFECGAASVKFVLDGFGCNPDEKDLQTIADELGTTAAESTSPQAIVSYLSAAGLAVSDRQNMNVDDLVEAARDNQVGNLLLPGLRLPGRARQRQGAVGLRPLGHLPGRVRRGPNRVLFFHDSSMGNMEREPGGDVPAAEADDERVLEMPGIRTILERDWIAAWHDEAVEGTLYDHYGISVGLPERSTPTAQLAQEAISE